MTACHAPQALGLYGPSMARTRTERTRQASRDESLARALPFVQGGYYLLTGLWPLVDMESFERVTGRKHDKWLVRTVCALAAAIGGGLVLAARNDRMSPELRTIAQGAATGFAAVEVPTALRGRISPVYLADALLEIGFVAAHVWAAELEKERATSR